MAENSLVPLIRNFLPADTGGVSNFFSSNQNISPLQGFFNSLQNWETSIPIQSLWMAFIFPPFMVTDSAMNNHGEQIGQNAWGIDGAWNKIGKKEYQTLTGCIFANGVGLPGERQTVTNTGIENRGWLKVPVGERREVLEPLRIDFNETNVSFIDFLIRPWLILSSHSGLVARNRYDNVKGDIIIVNFGKAGVVMDDQGKNTNQPIVRKMWFFSDCVPVTVNGADYTRGADSGPESRSIMFNYSRYQVQFIPEQLGGIVNNNGSENFKDIKRGQAAKLVTENVNEAFKDIVHGQPPKLVYPDTNTLKQLYDKEHKAVANGGFFSNILEKFKIF